MFLKQSVLFIIWLAVTAANVNVNDSQRQEFSPEHHANNLLLGDVNRIPTNAIPIYYDLYIVPCLENEFNFTGKVLIKISIKSSTHYLWLHSKDLNIKSVDVQTEYGSYRSNSYELLEADEMLRIYTSSTLYNDYNYVITIEFNGILNDENKGFYRSFHHDENNSKKWLAVTQFQPTYARMAFPCLDEPEYKAPIRINIARYSHQTAISNMPLLRTSDQDSNIDNRVWDTFMDTSPIPTYLVAFAVFQFDHYTSGKNSIWARKNAINYTTYALQESQTMLRRMELYTGVNYSLPKLDLVAVPDFSFGGMENWGLTMYRERCILAKENGGSANNLELVTRLVAHELSHQWFGDYVTPVWWNYLWLNEGFATYFEYFATAQEKPDWRFEEYFVVQVLQNALIADGERVQHPLTVDIQTPSQINSIFDVITYHKGASVIRMLEHIVTTPTFKKALNTYLMQNKENTVTPDQLWKAFENELGDTPVNSPKNITTIMKTWTDSVGYPLLNVKRIPGTGQFALYQETYRSSKSENPVSEWIIPVSYTTSSEAKPISTQPRVWVFKDKVILDEELSNDEWILCNLKQTGYYRVNYEISNWNLLTDQLLRNADRMDVLNKAQLIDDSFSLAYDGKLPFEIPLKLATYLATETDPIPWITGLKHLNHLYSDFEASSFESRIKNYVSTIIEKRYQYLGFYANATDNHLVKIVKQLTASLVCKLELSDCVENARNEFEDNRNDLSGVESDMKGIVFCTVLRSYTGQNFSNAWDNLWLLYRSTEIEYEKDRILTAMGCAKDEEHLKGNLYKLFDPKDTDLRLHQAKLIADSVSSSIDGVSAVIHFIVDTTSTKDRNLKNADCKLLVKIANAIKYRIKTEKQLKDLQVVIDDVNKLDLNKCNNLHQVLTEIYNDGVIELNKKSSLGDKILSSLDYINRVPMPVPIPPNGDTSPDTNQTTNQNSTNADTQHTSAGNNFTPLLSAHLILLTVSSILIFKLTNLHY